MLKGINGNGYSYPVISWSELDAWARLTGTEIPSRDARTIIELGLRHSNVMSEKIKDGAKG